MILTCERCSSVVELPARGRTPRFCSTRCRVAAHRDRHRLPTELTSRTAWTRRDGKRPIQIDGRPASSTDRSTWTTFAAVRASSAGDGFGVMLGDGLGCWDLDHCLDGDELAPWAADVLESIADPIWTERSLSGDGLHVFVSAAEKRGRRRPGVEFYSWGRFIVVTGDHFRT